MAFGGINYLAVILAAIAGFVVGAAYYGTLSKPWMKAARIDPASSTMSASLFVTTFLAELVMAWILAGLVGHLGPGQVTLWNGVVSAGFVWLGFVATTLVVNHRYGGFGWDLTVIDAIHWLFVLVVMGAIIGWFGA
jgi:hypothetical protein